MRLNDVFAHEQITKQKIPMTKNQKFEQIRQENDRKWMANARRTAQSFIKINAPYSPSCYLTALPMTTTVYGMANSNRMA